MKENPEFVEKIKGLVVTYVQDAVMGAEIPDVANKKDWGSCKYTDAISFLDQWKICLTDCGLC